MALAWIENGVVRCCSDVCEKDATCCKQREVYGCVPVKVTRVELETETVECEECRASSDVAYEDASGRCKVRQECLEGAIGW